MSLISVSRHAVNQNRALRSSYIEIARFLRLRYSGTIPNCSAAWSSDKIRFISDSRNLEKEKEATEAAQKLSKALEEFKTTILPSSWTDVNTDRHDFQVSELEPGRKIEMFGYLGTSRNQNRQLAFTMLTNKHQHYWIQLVSSSYSEKGSAAHQCIRSLRPWTPVAVRGKLVARRPPDDSQLDMTYLGKKLIGHLEIDVEHIQPLNEMPNDIIIKPDTVFDPEQRHLQLRNDEELRKCLAFRSTVNSIARSRLAHDGWTEIETPILFKSTPEGAREFLVPTRQKGLAYALPQSPQQYKQILMASGITKYFQFARCFRDEDLRADRQPEFTQLDMEMAFANEEVIMAETQRLLKSLWEDALEETFPSDIPKLAYHKAMAWYGSDKPDLRCKVKIHSITEKVPADLPRKMSPLPDPIIEAFRMPISQDPKITRRFMVNFLDSDKGDTYIKNPEGEPAVFVCDISKPMKGLGPLGYDYVMNEPEGLQVDHGDLLILQARRNAPFSGGSTVLGNLRTALHRLAVSKGLIVPEGRKHEFVWITDFPLFMPSTDGEPGQGGTAGFASTHHPFTAPKTPEDVDLLLTSPASAIAAHYDLVINGVEIGGGSRRIHNAAVQEFIFRDILKMKRERIEDFRHLLNVLRSGCPPHAGIALGWDRLVALMLKKESVRDVIAFPKSGRGEDLLVKSPNPVSQEQLDPYHLHLKN